MQLRALIELSGYCETRNQFLRCCMNIFHLSACNKNFLRIFCPAFAEQNIRMKDNEKNSEYRFNFFESFAPVFALQDIETFALGFIDVNQGLCHWSIIIKNCANSIEI